MSKITILAIEDDPIIAQTLEMVIMEMGHSLLNVVDNGMDALNLHQSVTPDLVLMDIKIKGEMNGIEVAEKMNEVRPTPIIFVTSVVDQTTFEHARALIPFAYITKPFNDVSLRYAVELAISRINGREHLRWEHDVVYNDSFFVKEQNRLVKVNVAEVLTVMVEGKYVKVSTGEKHVQVRMALKDLERQLPAGLFIRVHRNCLVNRSMIESIDLDHNMVYVKEYAVPLGVTFRNHVLKQLNMLH